MELINIVTLILLIFLTVINIFLCYKILYNNEDREIKKDDDQGKTLNDIIKSLPKNIILIYYIEGCSWCEKLRDMLKKLKNTKRDIISVYFQSYGNYTLSDNVNKTDKNIINKVIKDSISVVTAFPMIIKKNNYKTGCFNELKDLKKFINKD